MTKNFYLDENQGVDFFPQKPSEKVAANVAAIKLVKELEEEDRQASPAQQEILAKYVGWGGLANYFFDEKNPRFSAERSQLKSLVSYDEYASMKQSSLTAYYTDPDIARAMWDKVVQGDMERGNILDPSMGTGIFFMTMPEKMRAHVGNGIELYGVELDSITGAIAKQLFPEAKIYVIGFQDVHFVGRNFDIVISNIPFGNLRIMNGDGTKSYMIHDYFLKKSIDLVRDYGQVAIISSTGLMDKPTGSVLPEVMRTACFLGGIRMPQNAFKRLAGTDVTTDILFFQKGPKFEPAAVQNSLDAIHSTEKEYSNAAGTKTDKVFVNQFFQNQNNILGDVQISHFNGATFTVKKNDWYLEELPNRLDACVLDATKGFIDNMSTSKVCVQSPEEYEKYPKYEFVLDNDGNIVYRQDKETFVNSKPATVNYVENVSTGEKKFKFKSKSEEDLFNETGGYDSIVISSKSDGVSEQRKGICYYKKPMASKELKRIKGMVEIKSQYRKLIKDETISVGFEAIDSDLKALNKVYDEFEAEFGRINDKANMSAFNMDNYYPLIASLEEQKSNEDGSTSFVKGEAFTKPLIRGQVKAHEVNSAKDALLSSTIAGHGVDFAYMTSVYPSHSEEQILAELQQDDSVLPDVAAYTDSDEDDHKLTFLTKTDALSGDVVGKIETVKALIASKDSAYDWSHYLDLLEKAKPMPLTITDISFRLASTWIPNEVVATFLIRKFGTPRYVYNINPDVSEIIYNVGSERYISEQFVDYNSFGPEARKYAIRRNGDTLNKYDNALKIISYMLLGKTPVVTMSVTEKGKTRTIKDVASTQLLREAEYKLDKLFKDFVKSNEELTTALEDAYNHQFNRIVDKTYDGSELTVEGLSSEYELRDYQKNAVMRIITEKRALLAHEVGMGKTLTMISAGFKLKELGLANRPTFVVPSSLTAQFGRDIYKFYPNKHVLVAGKDDFSEVNRKSFMARIIANDYDAIVMSYEQFKVLEVSEETQKAFLRKQIKQLEESIAFFEENNIGDRFTVKRIESRKLALEKRAKRLSEGIKRDDFLTFEELGIDFLFVDEAHHFKNLQPVSLLGSIKGISTSNSQMANDMKMKVDCLHNMYGGRNVVFATGTPVSNSISEVWTMMDYIQPDVLKKYGIDRFDAFAGSFGLIESKLELDTTGTKYKESRRFSKFVNLPELMHIFKVSTDIKLGKSLDIEIPKAKTIVVPSELTPAQHEVIDELVERTEKMQDERIDPSIDNMLKVVHDARCLTLDMRLLGDYDRSDSSKLSQAADNIFRIWKRTKDVKGTQFVFSNMGTPGNKVFDAYNELKQILMNKGIPESEIAFVHSANTKEKKNILQKKVNEGDIRVLMGSTEKGGTGYNVQHRMKAIHHLDVPWRPSDLIQRNGRAIRNGNIFKEVEVYQYITKGSFDNYLWQIQENKLKYIGQVMTEEEPSRAINTADDVNDGEMTASEFKAIATENPYLKEKMEVDNRLTTLINQRSAKERNLRVQKRDYQSAVERLPKKQKQLEDVKADAAYYKANGAGKQITFVDGQVFEKATESMNHLLSLCWDAVNGRISPNEAVANIGGFDLLIQDCGTSSMNRSRYVSLVLRKNTTHIVDYISLSEWTGTGILIKMRNRLSNLPREVDKLTKDILDLDSIIKAGVDSDDDVEDMTAEIEYLSEKQAVLDKYLLNEADQNNVEELAEALIQFENSWRANHPEFAGIAKKAADKKASLNNADVEEKLAKAVADYDDSLFRPVDSISSEDESSADDSHEQQAVNKPDFTKKISTITVRKYVSAPKPRAFTGSFDDNGSMDLLSLLSVDQNKSTDNKKQEDEQITVVAETKTSEAKEEISAEKLAASFDSNGCMNLLDLLS